MGDPEALQEAIQRARQLAARVAQSAPVKRSAPGGPSDHAGPVKVTLAYEKPANANNNNNNLDSSSSKHDHHRSSSRELRRNERDTRDHKSSDHRDDNNFQRDSIPASRSNFSSGYTSSQNQHDSSGFSQISHPPPPPHSSGPPTSRSSDEQIELIIPHAVIGLVIGKGGENIRRIQNESGATVRVDPNPIDEKGNKSCTIFGTKQAVEEAHSQVTEVIDNASQSKRPRMQNDPSDSFRMKIPAHRTGAIIGKGGETIKGIKQQSGCEIELDKNSKECGPEESIFIIRGSSDKIQKARSLIEQRLARGARDGPGGGGGGGTSAGGGRDRHHGGGSDSSSNRSSRGVATGANAAPVAQFTDLPTPYAAQAGQQNSADMMAAWAACMAQYSTMFGQPGSQPNAQTTAASMAYGATAQPNSLLGNSIQNNATTMIPTMTASAATTPSSQLTSQQPASVEQTHQQAPNSANQTQDYTDQWIEFYLANGRPDYAEQMIQMKKQQQAQSAQSQQT